MLPGPPPASAPANGTPTPRTRPANRLATSFRLLRFSTLRTSLPRSAPILGALRGNWHSRAYSPVDALTMAPAVPSRDLTARRNQGNDDERRDRDQYVDQTAHDHGADSCRQWPLDCRDRPLLYQPHRIAPPSSVHRKQLVGPTRTPGTQVREHEVAVGSAPPNEPASLASPTRPTADIAHDGGHTGMLDVFRGGESHRLHGKRAYGILARSANRMTRAWVSSSARRYSSRLASLRGG